MKLGPAERAGGDQELAAFDEFLSFLVKGWPFHIEDEERPIRIATWAQTHSGLTHRQAMLLLAVAVDRLAR